MWRCGDLLSKLDVPFWRLPAMETATLHYITSILGKSKWKPQLCTI